MMIFKVKGGRKAALVAWAIAGSLAAGCTALDPTGADSSTSRAPAPAPTEVKPVSSRPLVEHKVEKGDSLWGLAREYGTTIEEIRIANGMTGDLIRAGDKIKIPTDKQARAKAPSPTDITPGVGTQPIEGAPAIPPPAAAASEANAPAEGVPPMTAEELRAANLRYFSDRPVSGSSNP